MHKIGDYIMYAGTVMQITDIGMIDFADNDKQYYILEEVQAIASSKTYVPTDNEKLVASMRPLMSEGEIRALAAEYEDIPALEWKSDNKQRSESFRRVIESQDARAMLGMIKSIENTAKMRQAEGKKSYITDMNAFSRAKKILGAEISFVMGISENEAAELFKSN